MKLYHLLITAIALTIVQLIISCSSMPSTSLETPSTPQESLGESPDTKPTPLPEVTLQSLFALADNSKCLKYSWKDRGLAPKAYIRGMTLAFAQAICNKDTHWGNLIMTPMLQDTPESDKKDALSWYASNFKALKMDISKQDVNTLRAAYTLLIGLGMRESSGKHCVGRDASATNYTSETCEAGAFQTSYNSWSAHKSLSLLYTEYKSKKYNCHLDTWNVGVNCSTSNWKNWGDGEGVIYQKWNKECPSFSAHYAAMMLRVSGGNKGHYGPLRTKAAEIVPVCHSLLQDVQAFVENNKSLCDSI